MSRRGACNHRDRLEIKRLVSGPVHIIELQVRQGHPIVVVGGGRLEEFEPDQVDSSVGWKR
jgi:hypothetical protein